MRRTRLALLVGTAALVAAAGARAEGIDGETPLVCDLVEVSSCDGMASCAEADFAQIDLPPVFHVDFEAKRLASEDGQRTSPIAARELLETALVLQGHQNGRGWTMVIDRASGHLSATVADAGGAVVVAGACAARNP